MMSRYWESRYQDVRVILEDLASYERRNLLPEEEAAPASAASRVDKTIISDH